MTKETLTKVLGVLLAAALALLAIFGYDLGVIQPRETVLFGGMPMPAGAEGDTNFTNVVASGDVTVGDELAVTGVSTFTAVPVWNAATMTFEGATANDYEITLSITDPTADRTVTLANAGGTVMLSALATNAADAANAVTGGSNALILEGATANDYETSVSPEDATADRTITLPNATGVAVVLANDPTEDQNLIFEGATGNDYETTLAFTDPTADRTVTFADGGGTVMLSSLATNAADAANAVTGASNGLLFEGTTANDFETTLSATDPTADRAVVFADGAGTVMLSALATNAADAANAVTGASNGLLFEGTTANDFETTLSATDPTADRAVVFADAAGTVMLSALATNAADAANAVTGASNGLLFEGATADDFEGSLTPTDPTADRTWTLPDYTGYIPVLANVPLADQNLIFEGVTANDYETTLAVTDPTADRTITLPDETGTVSLRSMAADQTLTVDTTNGNAGTRNQFIGVPRITLVGGAQGTNPGGQTIALVDDSPTGEFAPVDADVTEAEGSAGGIYRVGASCYAAAFAATAAATDGFIDAGLGAATSWEDMESVGAWVYSTATMAAGDLTLVLTDDGGARTFDMPAVTAAGAWTWVEVDISSLNAGTGDSIGNVAVLMSAAGETALGAFTYYLDVAYVWDAADEEALGQAIQTDGVLSVLNAEAGTNLVEWTDFLVHYETGNDFIVYITDQSTADVVALIAY